MFDGVQVRALSRPIQDHCTRALKESSHPSCFMARGIVLLEDKSLPLTIKRCCRGKHVVSEHSDVLVLSHGALTPVHLADTEPRHASPDHQGASSVLHCGDNALLAVLLTHSPAYIRPLCPTDKLKGPFVGPQHTVPLFDRPVSMFASER